MLVYTNIFFINIVIIYFGFVWLVGWYGIKPFPFLANFFGTFKNFKFRIFKKNSLIYKFFINNT